jgi:hypothetical protein
MSSSAFWPLFRQWSSDCIESSYGLAKGSLLRDFVFHALTMPNSQSQRHLAIGSLGDVSTRLIEGSRQDRLAAASP